MAFVKHCDNCGKKLGGQAPFVQTHGSVCDQYEPDDGTVEFRYLTDRKVYTFCDDVCDIEWRNKQREYKEYKTNQES